MRVVPTKILRSGIASSRHTAHIIAHGSHLLSGGHPAHDDFARFTALNTGTAKRTTLCLLAATVVAAGGAYWYTQPGHFASPAAQTDAPRTPKPTASTEHDTQLVEQTPRPARTLTLRMAPSAPLSSSHSDDGSARDTKSVDAKTAARFVENEKASPLHLDVPNELVPVATTSKQDAASQAERAALTDTALIDQPKTGALPKIEVYNIFNPEYGLRGFMKQAWVSPHVGFQGGLGLNDDRLIHTDSKFHEDIAVGMGIMVAF